ncbi:MAG TPA: diacylglycerol kinase family protein [Patescibacteria group bacterium]|nr:diacylglycerol kinase family protein [Patescibacteria group bacterium]
MIFFPRAFLKSFKHALRGLALVWRAERNFRVQALAGAVIFLLSLFLPLMRSERSVLIFAVVLVLVFEVANSLVERISDAFKPRLHPVVREIKDVTAAAVLLASGAAAAVGATILGPPLFRLFFP